ncbi:MAG: TlpA family protein disulfide reductase [Chitinophagales bacterium]
MKRLLISVLFSISLLNGCTPPDNSTSAKTEDAKTEMVGKKKPMKVPEVMDFAEFQERIKTTDDTLYIYNFWATWCMPCVKEMPYFEQVHDEFADQKVKLIFVSLDFIDMLSTKLLPFMIKRDLSEDVWLLNERNPNSWIDKVSEEWTGSIPATLFSHPPSNYKAFYERSFEYENLKEVVEQALKAVRK